MARIRVYGVHRQDLMERFLNVVYQDSYFTTCNKMSFSAFLHKGCHFLAIPQRTTALQFLHFMMDEEEHIRNYFAPLGTPDEDDGDYPGEDSCLHGGFQLFKKAVLKARLVVPFSSEGISLLSEW